MSMVNGGHLGRRRVSELLDGQLGAVEADAAWAHVHGCHACRDEVEHEGWVKTRLAGLSLDDPSACAPDGLKGALLGMPPGECLLGGPHDDGFGFATSATRPRRSVVGFAALGGGAAGAAVMGVLALGAATPADLPVPAQRQQPASQVTPAPQAPRLPARVPVPVRWLTP